MRQIDISTLSNQNISSYLLAHTYTADADRAIFARIHLDQVAGGGDYSVYATIQPGGAGSFFMEGPITTFTVPAAQTAIGFVSILIPVNSGDVVKFYVKGLAGDTATPDLVTRIFELTYLRPTTPGRTLDVTTTGEAGLDYGNVNGTPPNEAGVTTILADYARRTGDYATVAALAAVQGNITTILAAVDTEIGSILANVNSILADYARRTGDYSVVTIAQIWNELIAGHLGAGSVGATLNAAGSSGDPWSTALPGAYGAGTAGKIIGDQPSAIEALRIANAAAIVNSGVTGADIEIYNYSTVIATLEDLPDFSDYDKLWVTCKRNKSDLDSQALFHIQLSLIPDAVNDGLQYMNKGAGTHSDGSITVISSTSLSWTIKAASMSQLPAVEDAYYGVKKLVGADPVPVSEGGHCTILNITAKVIA